MSQANHLKRIIICLLSLLFLILPGTVFATGGAALTVNTTSDTDDSTCNAAHCSLREAILAANANTNPNTIRFNIPGAGPHTIVLTSPLPGIINPVTLNGTTEPDFAGVPVVIVDGSNAGTADGLVITADNSIVRGLVITGFSGSGVVVLGSGNTIRENHILNNGGLGIDLGNDGVTFNDTADADSGPNEGQNFPKLTYAIPDGVNTALQGQLNSSPNAYFIVDFYVNDTCDDSGYGEGQTYLGSTTVATDASGNAGFSFVALTSLPLGKFVTTTATNNTTHSTSEFSACTITSPGNDSWFTAYELVLSGSVPAVINHSIDIPDQSRWYKFQVEPDSQILVDLTNLPANYDLTVYRDISQVFQEEINGTQDLLLLSAEFAPDIFNPDIFSPDIFNSDIFNPDIFSPDIFSPDIFNPDIFNPDIFNPDIFSPDIFNSDNLSPDIFNPDIFDPDIFNPDIFNPDIFIEAFSSAQLRSAVGASGLDGLADEYVKVNTWDNDGFYYVRVRGRNGTYNPTIPFQLSVAVDGGTCAGLDDSGLRPTSLTAVSADYTTLILTDRGQLDLLYGTAVVDDLMDLLDDLAARPEVNGTVVDVGPDDRVTDARTLLNNYLTCPSAQNILADAIKAIVDEYWQANPNLQYLVLAGNDQVIPFYRHADQALLAPESNYIVPVREGTVSDATLELNYFLTQDDYGARVSVSNHSGELPIPELGIGRLVETPGDMMTVLNAYLSTPDGIITPTTSLVTGYDFLEDAALAVEEELRLGTNSFPDTLISPQTVAPENAWTADDLRVALLQNGRHDLVYMAGHFSAGTALAADYMSRFLAAEMTASSVDMANSLVFSAGCHSGYSIVNADGIPQLTPEPDWAQAFAQKGATLVAGTGYQYGDTDFIEYGERLYLLFSQQLRSGDGPVAVGQALSAAKQQYLENVGAETADIYPKQMLIATLYGLPMLRVDMPGQRIQPGSDPSIVTDTTGYANPGPGQTLGLQFADITITPTLTLVIETLTNTNNISETIIVSYLTGGVDQQVVVNPAQPVLPLETRQVGVPGMVLRGIGFWSGMYSGTEGIRPLTGVATYDLSGPRPIFTSDYFYPARLWDVNYYGAILDPADGGTKLMLTPAQYRSDGPGSPTGTLRQFDLMQFRLFYSNNTTTYSGNTPYLSNPPAISHVQATTDEGDINFQVQVVGDPSAGVQEVWVTWSDATDLNGVWQSVHLTQNSADATLWEGTLTASDLNGTAPGDVRFMAQAVNGVGLVTLVTNLGQFYRPDIDPGALPQGDPTELVLESPGSGVYGANATVSAVLTSNGTPLADQLVRFSLGSQRTAVTDADGRATVTLPLLLTPDTHRLQVMFGGTADYQPAHLVSLFTITKRSTTLTLTPSTSTIFSGEDSGMVVTLGDSSGNALVQKTIIFTVEGAEGSYMLAGITNFAGRLSLGNVSLPAGSYTVTAHFGDSFTLPGGTPIDMTQPNYTAATATATLIIAEEPHETLYISLSSGGTIADIHYDDEDILAYDTVTGIWSLYFDGTDVGLRPRDMDAFTVAGDGSILLSTSAPLTLPDVGAVQDADIVRFVPTSLGDDTAGTFEMYFDGSDVELTTHKEDVDAITFAPDGRLILSTLGNFAVTGASGTNADLIAFNPTSLGDNTSGTWELYFDGSDVDLTTATEDVKGAWVDEETGEVYLNTKGNFTVVGLSGDGADIFICTPGSLGDNTSCTFELFWDGGANGFNGKRLDGFVIRR